MNALFPSIDSKRHRAGVAVDNTDLISPHYETEPTAEGIELKIYVPEVDANGIEIVVRGPDLVVVARKRHPLRVNFAAANLESVRRDYELRLRLGRDLDYAALEAVLDEGVLTLRVPRRHLKAA